MEIEEIRKKLSERGIAKVARKIGMNRQQLWRIANGSNTNPTLRTIERISEYLEKESPND